jgi:uncharacterized protein GlcG (DUF336 family)
LPIRHALIRARTLTWNRRTSTRVAYALCLALSLAIISCGSGTNSKAVPPPVSAPLSNLLTQLDVENLVQAAAGSINVPLTIAVSDRRGQIIAVYSSTFADPHALVPANFGILRPADEVAAALARTAAFFSNDQAPIGSRTVRYLSGIHFPPGIMNTESAPLYGIENTNRGCGFNTTYLPGQSLPVPNLLNQPTQPGLGILTGKADLLDSDPNAVNPGGVPIFKNNRVAGGIGVVTAYPTANYNAVVEYAAVVGTIGIGFTPIVPYPGAVVLGGVTLPFVKQTTMPDGYFAGNSQGTFSVGPMAASGAAPEGDLIPEHGSSLGGLTQAPCGRPRSFRHRGCGSRRVTSGALSYARRHALQRGCRRRQVPKRRLLQRQPEPGRHPWRPTCGHRHHQPHPRLRRATALSGRHRRNRARPVLSTLRK